MIRHLLAATALLAPVPTLAQSAQETLDARYDRALAAGYKALMLCGGIASSGPSSQRRSEASVIDYELTGIYPALGPIVRELPHRVERGEDGFLDYVAADWAEDMPPRIALHKGAEQGCALLPIGAGAPDRETPSAMRIDRVIPPGTPRRQPSQTTGRHATLAATALGERYGAGTRTTAVLVQRDGRILGEAFAPGFDGDLPQRTWSVAKSLAATLIGAAVQRGEADVAASAGLGLADGDPRRAITVDHLLRMASGRYSDTVGNRTDPLYFGGATVDERAATWPLIHPPGTTFRYANNDTLMAVKTIEDTFDDAPPAGLFERLGMYQTIAETDWQGNYILSSQVWASARDLAKLGQLYLDDGVLPGGERVLPDNWLEYVSSPSGPQPTGEFGYGAGFWLFDKSDGIPPDTIAMMGNRGQYVVIVPSQKVLIVRRGEDPTGARFDIAAFTRDVLATLRK
ncbi:serine hydrolase domain-containing protein [Pelagerythrobacter sp.]|uniref:serine hydrolase domain-containing protein n=1 Tax=Pelagerythrobacter sp. TaxID=2800702 RepID=UPI0035B401E1